MGISIKTNLKFTDWDPGDTSTDSSSILNSAITIFNNDSQIDYSVFDDFFVDDERLIPNVVTVAGGRGAGGLPQELMSLLFDPTSHVFLPTIVINGALTKLTIDGTVGVLKLLFRKLKGKYKRKRLRVMYFTDDDFSFFEFPTETDEREFEKGLKTVPNAIKNSFKGKYFVRSFKQDKWIEEDIE